MTSSYKASWCRSGYYISHTILLLSHPQPPSSQLFSAVVLCAFICLLIYGHLILNKFYKCWPYETTHQLFEIKQDKLIGLLLTPHSLVVLKGYWTILAIKVNKLKLHITSLAMVGFNNQCTWLNSNWQTKQTDRPRFSLLENSYLASIACWDLFFVLQLLYAVSHTSSYQRCQGDIDQLSNGWIWCWVKTTRTSLIG